MENGCKHPLTTSREEESWRWVPRGEGVLARTRDTTVRLSAFGSAGVLVLHRPSAPFPKLVVFPGQRHAPCDMRHAALASPRVASVWDRSGVCPGLPWHSTRRHGFALWPITGTRYDTLSLSDSGFRIPILQLCRSTRPLLDATQRLLDSTRLDATQTQWTRRFDAATVSECHHSARRSQCAAVRELPPFPTRSLRLRRRR